MEEEEAEEEEVAPFSTSLDPPWVSAFLAPWLAPWFSRWDASRASRCWRKRWKRRRTGWSGGRSRGASFFLLCSSSSSRFTSLIFRKMIYERSEVREDDDTPADSHFLVQGQPGGVRGGSCECGHRGALTNVCPSRLLSQLDPAHLLVALLTNRSVCVLCVCCF